MKANNIYIIANPTAQSGKATETALYVSSKIKRILGAPVNLIFTKEKNDATRATRVAIYNGASLIVSIGGDGTINEIVNGFYLDSKQLNPMCELGIINCGTAGGFANALKIPSLLDEQIDLILEANSTTYLDLGKITYQDNLQRTNSRLFVNECQIGVGSKVASIVSTVHKVLGARLAYGMVAALQAIVVQPIPLNIAYDDEPGQRQELVGLVVGNGVECAGGMKLTPDAKLNDGLFDVLSMNNMNIFEKIKNLSKVYSGTHILSKYFSVKRCKKLMIESDEKITLEADGEMIGNAPFKIEILPAAIKVKVTGLF